MSNAIHSRGLRLGAAGLALVALAATAVTSWPAKDPAEPPPPALSQARGAQGLVLARPFVLAEGYTHWYRAERPTVDAGYLLVLEVDPQLAAPRQLAEPVLYVGAETAERVNHGSPSGRLVAIVPAPRGADGLPALDLLAAPIFHGAARLPEQVSFAAAQAERAAASQAGVAPFDAARVEAALAAGGGLLELPDKTALERVAAELVLRYAPGEEELAGNLLVPLSR